MVNTLRPETAIRGRRFCSRRSDLVFLRLTVRLMLRYLH